MAHEGAGCGVVAAHARVYILEELVALRDGHASPQDAGRGALVQLAVDESECLGHPGDASGLGPFRGEFPSIHPGDGSMSMASDSLTPYSSSGESTYDSFEGSSSLGSAPAGFEGAPEGSSQFEGCGSRLTDDWAMSRAKTFGGTMIRPDAILASSSASSLYGGARG
jgi:hypothetical protein